MKTETSVFPKRVVLAEGYPWASGGEKYFELTMRDRGFAGRNVPLDFPKVLWDSSLPKYRLVLELVE